MRKLLMVVNKKLNISKEKLNNYARRFNMKKFLSVLLISSMVFIVSVIPVLAENDDSLQKQLAGYTYDLYFLETEKDINDIIVSEKNEILTLEFLKDNEKYHIDYKKGEQFQYEAYFKMGSESYYSFINSNGSEYVGLIRQIDDVVGFETKQFGFVLSNDEEEVNKYEKLFKTATHSELANVVEHNASIKRKAVPLAVASGIHKVEAYAPFDDPFAQVWGDISGTANYKTCKITKYNILIGVIGDGCHLREFNNSGYSRTLWSTPVSPPRGVQTVNKTYNISYSYSASLEVSVSGFYDIYGVPVPLPLIWADSYVF